MQLMFRVFDEQSGDRCSAPIELRESTGQLVFEGASKDERFDANDHLSVAVEKGKTYELTIPSDEGTVMKQTIQVQRDGQLVDVTLDEIPETHARLVQMDKHRPLGFGKLDLFLSVG